LSNDKLQLHLRPLLSCRPIEYDSFIANYVVTNIYQPRLTIIL